MKKSLKSEAVYLYPETLTRREALNMLDKAYRLPNDIEEVKFLLGKCPWLIGNYGGEWYYTDGTKDQALNVYLLMHRPYLAIMRAIFNGVPVLVEPHKEVDLARMKVGVLFVRRSSLKEWLQRVILRMSPIGQYAVVDGIAGGAVSRTVGRIGDMKKSKVFRFKVEFDRDDKLASVLRNVVAEDLEKAEMLLSLTLPPSVIFSERKKVTLLNSES